MLWPPFLGEEEVVDQVVPHHHRRTDAHSEERAEETALHVGRPDDTGHPILDVPCCRIPDGIILVVDIIIVVVIVVNVVDDGDDFGCHCGGGRRVGVILGVAVIVRLCGCWGPTPPFNGFFCATVPILSAKIDSFVLSNNCHLLISLQLLMICKQEILTYK